MNWTGGRLSRHSNPNRSLKARQKQHFAKVQASIRNGAQKPSQLKGSLLGNIIESNVGSCRSSSGGKHPNSRGNLLLPPHQSSSYSLQVPLDTDLHPGPGFQRPQSINPTNRDPLTRKVDRVPEDDLYNATPLPIGRKRKQDFPIAQTARESEQDQGEVSQSERRRRVLRKGDWVGVSIQRPLQLTFASSNNAELVGRRRKVTDGHQAKYDHKRQSFRGPPIAAMNQKLPPGTAGGRQYGMAQLRTSDVTISIGGRVVPPGFNSSSISSTGQEQSARNYHFGRSPVSSSDVMLLDNEDYPGSELQASKRCSCSVIEKPEIYGNRSDRYEREYNSLGWNSATDFGYDEYEDQSTRTGVSHAGNCGNRIRAIRRSIQKKQGESIVSTSTASLEHPKPQSFRTSLLLRSDSAEITSGIVAQVGNLKPMVPRSQVVDNELWESWVGPTFNEHSVPESAHDHGSSNPRKSVSPAVSHFPGSCESNEECSRYSAEYPSTESEWAQSSRCDELSQSPNQPPSITTGEIYGGIPISSNVEMGEILCPETQCGIQQRFQPDRNGDDQPVKAPEDSDTDKIWQKFVFGSSDDEIEVVEDQIESGASTLWSRNEYFLPPCRC